MPSLDLSELDRVTAAGELSDADLDQVVGGRGPLVGTVAAVAGPAAGSAAATVAAAAAVTTTK